MSPDPTSPTGSPDGAAKGAPIPGVSLLVDSPAPAEPIWDAPPTPPVPSPPALPPKPPRIKPARGWDPGHRAKLIAVIVGCLLLSAAFASLLYFGVGKATQKDKSKDSPSRDESDPSNLPPTSSLPPLTSGGSSTSSPSSSSSSTSSTPLTSLRLEAELAPRLSSTCDTSEPMGTTTGSGWSGGAARVFPAEGCWVEWDVTLLNPAPKIVLSGFIGTNAGECGRYALALEGMAIASTEQKCQSNGNKSLFTFLTSSPIPAGLYKMRVTSDWTLGALSANGLVDYVEIQFDQTPPGANRAPNAPSSPIPANGVQLPGTSTTLKWSASDPDGETSLTYTVYLAAVNPPLTTKCTGIAVAQCATGTLTPLATYYWKVIASDGSLSTSSPVWSFKAGTGGPVIG